MFPQDCSCNSWLAFGEKHSTKLLWGFLSFDAWRLSLIVARKIHGRLSKKIPDHSKMAKMYKKECVLDLAQLRLTILMTVSVKFVLIFIIQSAKTVCSNKICSWVFEVEFVSVSKCDDPMIPYEPRYVLISWLYVNIWRRNLKSKWKLS